MKREKQEEVPVTKWYRFYPDTKKEKAHWEFNHIQMGHVEANKPTLMFPEQKSWLNATWMFKHAYLIDGKVVDNPHNLGRDGENW
jgi:hypothetical protein